jgi:hypothetical protein
MTGREPAKFAFSGAEAALGTEIVLDSLLIELKLLLAHAVLASIHNPFAENADWHNQQWR